MSSHHAHHAHHPHHPHHGIAHRVTHHLSIKKKTSMELLGTTLFETPRSRFSWGEVQPEHGDVVWGQLYFDLTYVGVAFKLGLLLADAFHNTNSNTILPSFGLFIAIYSIMEAMWNVKWSFDVRLEANDIFHRVFFLVAGSIAAYAAMSITTLNEMNDPQSTSTLSFSCATFAYFLVDLFVYIELAMHAAKPNERRMAVSTLTRSFFQLPLLIAAVITSYYGVTLQVTAALWFVCSQIFRIAIYILAGLKILTRENTVPIHVSFAIHRANGEYVMLFLGESIISIIIVPFRASAEFILTWFFSYMIVAALTLLHFVTVPMDANHHAMRRSSTRAMLFTSMQSIFCMSLICVGTGFKLVLGHDEEADGDVPNSFIWMLSGSLCAAVLVCVCGRVLHAGVTEEFLLLKENKLAKAALWFAKIALAGLMLVSTSLQTRAWGVMLYLMCLTILVYFVQVLDVRMFLEHHEYHVGKEVEKRMLSFGKSPEEAKHHHSHAHSHGRGHGHAHHEHHPQSQHPVEGGSEQSSSHHHSEEIEGGSPKQENGSPYQTDNDGSVEAGRSAPVGSGLSGGISRMTTTMTTTTGSESSPSPVEMSPSIMDAVDVRPLEAGVQGSASGETKSGEDPELAVV